MTRAETPLGVGLVTTTERRHTVSDNTGYNGWSNYPTWAVNLWLSNDEGLYSGTVARIEAAQSEGRWLEFSVQVQS